MPGNVTTEDTDLSTVPTGTVIATDNIGGVNYQRVKVTWGAGGTANDANAATPLPVDLTNTGANATALKVDGSAVTQPVSAASLPLPTGAATAANQSTGNTSLASILSTLGGTLTVSGSATVTQATASSLNATVVGTGTFAVQAAQSGTWNIGTVTTVTTVAAVTAITNALPAGTNTLGSVTPTTNAASGGISSTARLVSAANSTNATNVKASAGRIYSIQLYNAASSIRYLKLYNKATAPTVGTDTPVKTIPLPPFSGMILDWGNIGYYFSTGIGFGLTTGSADADTGALTAADVVGLGVDYV